jgi:hypothetical protein
LATYDFLFPLAGGGLATYDSLSPLAGRGLG